MCGQAKKISYLTYITTYYDLRSLTKQQNTMKIFDQSYFLKHTKTLLKPSTISTRHIPKGRDQVKRLFDF